MEATADRTGPQATLCTVLTPAHVELGALNRQLTRALNPASPVCWSITYNPGLHRPGARTAGGEPSETAPPVIPGAAVHLGPTLHEVFQAAFDDPAHAAIPAEERLRLLRKYLGSYHHAAGLAHALDAVETRYAIIIDPDFYVLRRGWIDEVIAHMAREDLAIFGAPWNPRWYQKYRGFPSTHLLAIDLDQAPWARSLLAPDLIGGGRRFGSELWTRYAASPRQGGPALLRHPWRALTEDLRQRRSIGSARDTGHALMQAFRARPELKTGLLQAAFSPEDGFMPPAVSRLQRHGLLEAWLPDRLRYLPRGRAAWTRHGFRELGLPSFREHGWEEFVWRGAPFAVHVRGELQRRPGAPALDAEQVRAALSTALAKLGEPALEPAAWLEPAASIP